MLDTFTTIVNFLETANVLSQDMVAKKLTALVGAKYWKGCFICYQWRTSSKDSTCM